MEEEKIGEIVKYFAKPGVAAIQLTKGILNQGDTIHIKSHSTDFQQEVQSMQVQHQEVNFAGPGDPVGIKVKERARESDSVYKIII